MANDERMIAALLRERGAYVAQGRQDRVDQVDEQLRRLGHDPEHQDQHDGLPAGRSGIEATQQTADATTTVQGPAGSSGVSEAAEPEPQPTPPVKKTAPPRRGARTKSTG
ncbi:hypothetical protein [Streptomyces niveus]|uniref:hypothetical protein n=1 Tax=Streptomyces niveus TaxID=193462 RepID=UPI0036D26940